MNTVAYSLAGLFLTVMPAMALPTPDQQEERMMDLARARCGPFADKQAALVVRQASGPTGPRFLRDVRSQYFYACLSGQGTVAKSLADLADSGQIKPTILDACIRAVEERDGGSGFATVEVRECVSPPDDDSPASL